jgi:hypothetical protein
LVRLGPISSVAADIPAEMKAISAAMPMKPDYGSPLWGSPKAFRKRVLLWKIAGGVLLAAVAVGVIHTLIRVLLS